VILIDANLLLYACNEAAPEHAVARKWLDEAITSGETVRFAWSTLNTFLRIATHRSIFPRPMNPEEAIRIVDELLRRPSVGVLDPADRYWSIFAPLAVRSQARGDLVPDAHLAALAIEHGATLCTTDKDFARFDGLRVINPLQKK